jgi:hypothetical protein
MDDDERHEDEPNDDVHRQEEFERERDDSGRDKGEMDQPTPCLF